MGTLRRLEVTRTLDSFYNGPGWQRPGVGHRRERHWKDAVEQRSKGPGRDAVRGLMDESGNAQLGGWWLGGGGGFVKRKEAGWS